MLKGWIAMAVCGGAAGFFAWGTSQATQAAFYIGSQPDMSMVEQVKAKKGKARAAPEQCNNFLLTQCCTVKGKETCTPGPM